MRSVELPAEVKRLEAGLRDAVDGEVRFSDGDRAMYAFDASVYRQVPIGVVLPKTVDDIERAVAVCREFDVPVLPRGCGTSLAGQCCNTAVVIDTSKYVHGILEIDAADLTARVQPGVVCDSLQDATLKKGLIFGPDPATHDHCTIGGMIGNNSCGTHALQAGRTADNVLELDILTYDGTRMRVGATPQDDLLGSLRLHYPLLLAIAYTAGGRFDAARKLAEPLRGELPALRAYYVHPQVYLWSAAQVFRMLGYPEADTFLAAARERKDEILAGIDDETSQGTFRRFVFNRLIDERIYVDDPMHAWYTPYAYCGIKSSSSVEPAISPR